MEKLAALCTSRDPGIGEPGEAAHGDVTVEQVRLSSELEGEGRPAPSADVAEYALWLGDDALHLSHRSALLRKDPAFYGPIFGTIADDLPYYWPPSDR